MNKYLTLAGISLQKQLEVRSDFLFERTRSLSIMISIYFLWSALLNQNQGVLGYSKEQLLTYVLLMSLLRALVLGCVTDRIPMEIAKGNLSDVLLRPISHLGYWAAQDAASKSLNLASAVVELTVFSLIVSAPFFIPHDPLIWLSFGASILGGMVIYFQMSYALGVIGFWTAQSWGPRFCFEIVLEFCGGAYFPLDFLPQKIQTVLSWLPFPYLVFYPLSIYLGRVDSSGIIRCLTIQMIWIVLLAIITKWLWRKGLAVYGAEGR